MDVIVLDDDKWWRDRIVRDLTHAGHRCHAFDGADRTPPALADWRRGLGLSTAAAIVDVILDTGYDDGRRRASFDAVARWRDDGFVPSPLRFVSSSPPAGWEARQVHDLGGGVCVIKQDVESWSQVLQA